MERRRRATYREFESHRLRSEMQGRSGGAPFGYHHCDRGGEIRKPERAPLTCGVARQGRAAKIATAIFERLTESRRPRRTKHERPRAAFLLAGANRAPVTAFYKKKEPPANKFARRLRLSRAGLKLQGTPASGWKLLQGLRSGSRPFESKRTGPRRRGQSHRCTHGTRPIPGLMSVHGCL